jgi:ribosome recycling factor
MMSELSERFNRTVESIKGKMSGIRTGRANPDLLSHVSVNYYGSNVPLKQVANISVMEGNTFVLSVFDHNAVSSVEKAIHQSDLGLNPQTEGSVIRMRLPDLTQERRKELAKVVKHIVEDGKVALRNIRRDEIESLKKDELSEDELKVEQAAVQKELDKAIATLDKVGEEKEKEIMTI